MNRRFTLSALLFTLLLAGLMASTAFALTYHPWANQIVPKLTASVRLPQEALHAPNGRYAQIELQTGILTLDLGQNEEGLGNLMIYHKGLGTFAPTAMKVEFLDENFRSIYSTSAALSAGVGPKKTLVYFRPTSVDVEYRYVRLGIGNKTIEVDAVEIVNITPTQ